MNKFESKTTIPLFKFNFSILLFIGSLIIISDETKITLLDKKEKKDGVHAFIATINFLHSTSPLIDLTINLS